MSGLFTVPVFSYESQTTSLSLADAQSQALKRNLDLKTAQSQVEAALAQIRIAKEFPNPSLGISTAKINTDGTSNATPAGNKFLNRSYDSIISLNQFLELGGKRGLREDAAKAGHISAIAQLDDTKRLVLLAVSQAYVAALEARKEANIMLESSRSLSREAGIATERFRAGDIAETDKAQLEISAKRLELDALASEQNAKLAVILVETLIGEKNPQGQTQLTDSLERVALQVSTQVDKTLASARPDIAAAEANLTQAEATLSLEKRGVIPDLTLSLQYEKNPPDSPNTGGIGLSLPLPLWNRNQGSILAARSSRDQAALQLEKVRMQATADVSRASFVYDEAKNRSSAYTQELMLKSKRVVESLSYAYEHGGAALVDLLSAERNDNDIRISDAQAKADVISASLALSAALNRISPQ
jgi:cobalt-zinc-cadmium efflux system outer membrane protein